MKTILADAICSVLSTMPGYPAWEGEKGQMLDERYSEALLPVPDCVGNILLRDVDKHFGPRPSVHDLLAWAATLAPQKEFRLSDIDRPAPSQATRADGMPAAQLEAPSGRCPDYVRRQMAAFFVSKSGGKAQPGDTADPALVGDWGLVYVSENGNEERLTPRWSREEALRRAAEFNALYSHKRAGVYQAKPLGMGSRLTEAVGGFV